MRISPLLVSISIAVIALSGCGRTRREARLAAEREAAMASGAPLPGPIAGRAPETERRVLTGVSVAIRGQAKDRADTVIVRLSQGATLLSHASLGAGEAWPNDFMRVVDFSLATPVEVGAATGMRLDVMKTSAAGDAGRPWTIWAEALGNVGGGGEVRLLELTQPVTIGGGRGNTASWGLAVR